MHKLPRKDLDNWHYGHIVIFTLSMQCWLYGIWHKFYYLNSLLHGVRGGEVQDIGGQCRMHQLRRQHVLCDRGRYSVEYLSDMPGWGLLACRQ